MKSMALDIALFLALVMLGITIALYTTPERVCINGKVYEKTDAMYIATRTECLPVTKD
jgi:hypothetical protein